MLCCEICQLIIFQVLLLKKRLAISMNGTLSFDQVEKSLSSTHLRPSINDLHLMQYQHQLFPKHKDKSLLLQNVFLFRSVRKSFSKRSSLRSMNWWTQGSQSNIYYLFYIPSITIFAAIIPHKLNKNRCKFLMLNHLSRWKGKLLFVICKLKMFLADQEVREIHRNIPLIAI